MLRSRTLALLAALAMLALPASSLAQSAGDDQYSDPLKGQPNGGSNNGGGGGSNGGGGGSTPTTPAGTGTGTDGTATPQATAAQSPNGELPRTGVDVILTIELGIAMLLTGLVSQRLVVLRDRRDT
jgi:hypothetical protein